MFRIAPRSEAALKLLQQWDGRAFTISDLYDYVASFQKPTPDESTQWIAMDRSREPKSRE